jgi:hypothetical protein
MSPSDTIVLIPARMAASRLPGKPLADIHGEPMIVHVWRRAVAAAVGRVAGRDRRRRIAAAVQAAGGEAVMTGAAISTAPTGSTRRWRIIDPGGTTRSSTSRATCRPSRRSDSRRARRCSAIRPSTSRRSPPRSSGTRSATTPQVVKVVGTPIGARPAACPLFHPRHRAVGGGAALPPHRPLRLSPRALARFVALPPSPLELREKLEQLRALEDGMRIDVGLVDTCRSASTPRTISTAPAACSAEAVAGHPLGASPAKGSAPSHVEVVSPQEDPIQGEPGANSHLACQQVYPDYEAVPCPTFEDCFARSRAAAPISR